MSDALQPAVAMLQKKLDEQLRSVGETKRLINMLLKEMGREPMYADETAGSSGAIRADQFYGKQLASAAGEYLEIRKQACQPTDILAGLQAGGFDFGVMGWKEGDELRMLALSLAKNNVKFHKLKNGSFGLRAWYDEEFLRRASRQKAQAAAADQVSSKDENAEPTANGSGDLTPKETTG